MYLMELEQGKSTRQEVSVSFEDNYDVVVAGLGTAGAIAALSAAENGASVLGIDKLSVTGGTGTAGAVFGYYFGIPGGRFEDIDAKSKEIQDGNFLKGGSFSPETKPIVLERELAAAGAKVLFRSTVIGVYLDEANTPCGVRVVTKDGVKDVGCSILIDASGDGEVCAMAGAKYREGRELDDQPQPFSSVRMFKRGENVAMANFDAGYIVASDGDDMTRGIIASSSLHLCQRDEKMQELLTIATIPGLREGRLIDGDETLTFPDFMDGKVSKYPPVALCYSNFDSHSQDWAFTEELAKDWMVAGSLWGKNFTFPVPLECMTVKGFSNLLAVGRCLSVDHMIACALRMQRGMQKLGQAAGMAAAMAVRDKTTVRDINRQELINNLEASGCLNEPEKQDWEISDDPTDLKKLLAGEKPGEAIWHMSRNPDKYEDCLLAWLGADDQNLVYHSAITLGLMKRTAALPILRNIIESGDDFLPQSGRSQNQRRILAAIHLLGKLEDLQSVDLLLEHISTTEDVQDFSHCLMSLLRIGHRHEAVRAQIRDGLLSLMEHGAFKYELIMKNSSSTGRGVYEPLEKLMSLLSFREFKSWGFGIDLPTPLTQDLTWRESRLLKALAG